VPIAPIIAPVLTYDERDEIVMRIDLQNTSETAVRYLMHNDSPDHGVYDCKFELFYRGKKRIPAITEVERGPADASRVRSVHPGQRVARTINITKIFGPLRKGTYTLMARCRQPATFSGLTLTPMSCYRTVAFLTIE